MSSSSLPQLPNAFTVAAARRSPLEDKTLHRGGKELVVEKLPDRFTVAVAAGRAAQLVSEKVAEFEAEILQEIPEVGIELRVRAEQLDEAMAMLRTSDEVLYVSHVYQLRCSPGVPIYLTNQLTLWFAESVMVEEMKTIATSAGLAVFKLIPGVPKAFVFQVAPQARVNPLKLANQLMHHPQVLLAEPNILVNLRSLNSLNSLSHFPYANVPSNKPYASIKAAWNYTQGAESIVIATAEAAIDFSHPVFQVGGRVVAPLVRREEREERGERREEEEGRRSEKEQAREPIAGMLARIAPGCGVMPMAIGSFLDDAIVEQLCEWVVEKEAAVLICEWCASLDYYPLSLRQQAALTRAATRGQAGKGCWIGFAVETNCLGGGGKQLGENPRVQDREQKLNGFAIHPDVMAIAPIAHGQAATSPPWETHISIWAPSLDSEKTTAGAIVAGVAALMLSANPDLTARQVKHLLQTTADKLAPNSSHSPADPATACDVICDANGYSQEFGYGKVNPLRAIQAAQHLIQPSQSPSRWIERQVTTAVDIPDGDRQGMITSIHIDDASLVHQIQVSVDIEHSFMGDLEIYLLPPQGNPILLQPRTAGRVNILRKTYTPDTTPLLKHTFNQPAKGKWQLKVIDPIPFHTGRLKSWGIRLGVI
jgi:subtilisin-like proprotein convertase family protein